MIPSEQPLRTIVEVLIGLAMWAGIVWPVIFVAALLNRRPDRPPLRFFGNWHDYLPKQPPEVWWHHLIRLPFYCGFILFVVLVNFLFIPPILFLELSARLRAKIAHRN